MKKFLIVLFAFLVVAAGTGCNAGAGSGLNEKKLEESISAAPLPESFLPAEIDSLFDREPASELGKQIYSVLREKSSFQLRGDFSRTGQTASQNLDIVFAEWDTEALAELAAADMNAQLAQKVEAAALSSDIYDDSLHYRSEILEPCLQGAIEKILPAVGDKSVTKTIQLNFTYDKDGWQLTNRKDIEALVALYFPEDMDALAQTLKASVEDSAEYVQKIYTIEEGSTKGQVPNPNCFGSTDDPSVIEELLQTPYAKQLIGDQELVWNAELERIEDTQIEYYLDESLLVLVWKEDHLDSVTTFSEVFIADGSQLRRRIIDEEKERRQPEKFDEESNAVLTLGGDTTYRRTIGVLVYDRELLHVNTKKTDTCYITSSGDMLFSYHGELKSEEEAKAFIEENDVVFSIVFGPVLIDNGEDVTPKQYAYGEITQKFPRSVLGMMGERHYLSMNINGYSNKKSSVCTLRQAADIMIEKGCIKAYTLDGGQTAVTIFNGRIINPVLFGYTILASDIIYFATAVPSAETSKVPAS